MGSIPIKFKLKKDSWGVFELHIYIYICIQSRLEQYLVGPCPFITSEVDRVVGPNGVSGHIPVVE